MLSSKNKNVDGCEREILSYFTFLYLTFFTPSYNILFSTLISKTKHRDTTNYKQMQKINNITYSYYGCHNNILGKKTIQIENTHIDII